MYVNERPAGLSDGVNEWSYEVYESDIYTEDARARGLISTPPPTVVGDLQEYCQRRGLTVFVYDPNSDLSINDARALASVQAMLDPGGALSADRLRDAIGPLAITTQVLPPILEETAILAGAGATGGAAGLALQAGADAATAGMVGAGVDEDAARATSAGLAMTVGIFGIARAMPTAGAPRARVGILARASAAEIDAAVSGPATAGPMIRAPAPTGSRYNISGGMMVNEHTVPSSSSGAGASGDVATRIRVQTYDPTAPAGTNSRTGSTVSITQRGGARRLIPGSGWIRTSEATDAEMDASHIPIHR